MAEVKVQTHRAMADRFSSRAEGMKRSPIRELLKLVNKPGLISFAGGLPHPGSFPARELAEICHEVIQSGAEISLQYSATEGLTSLRDLLVSFMAENGLKLDREELVITTASQQSLDLMGKIFLDRGDLIITENPSYLGAVSAFKSYGTNFLAIEMDEEGLRTDLLRRELEALQRRAGRDYLREKLKFLYTVPDFQNPSGITMSLPRRRELLEIASEFDFLIVEDMPYRWLRFAGETLPMLSALECGPDDRPCSGFRRVIDLFTFSKILSPGIRLGWVTAAAEVIDKLVQAKQSADLCTSALSQRIAEEFLKRGLIPARIRQNCDIYRRKLAVMLEALEQHMPKAPGLCWTRPQGGLFLWLILPEAMNTEQMFAAAIARNVAYVVGASFYPNGGGHNTMRLNFSFPTEEEIREGIRRLAGLVASWQ